MVKINSSLKIVLCGFLVIFFTISYNGFVKAIPFKTVLPILTNAWYPKAGPAESVFFGLFVLKIIALRMAGILPYELTELLSEGSYIDKNVLVPWNNRKKSRTRTGRDLFYKNNNKMNKFSKAPLLQEIDTVERILLGLRRIDSHDCFIRHVCNVNQKSLAGKSTSYDEAILKIFSLKPKKANVKGEKNIWDIYGDALRPQITDCADKYKMCPLTKQDMKINNLLTGLF